MQKDEKVWTNQFGCGKGSVIFSHGKSDARGILVAFREAVDYKINSQHVDNNGRYIVLNLLINGSPVILVNPIPHGGGGGGEGICLPSDCLLYNFC